MAGLEGWEGEQWELRSEGKGVWDLVRILEKCRDLPLLLYEECYWRVLEERSSMSLIYTEKLIGETNLTPY